MKSKKGLFITFEGGEGSGKTTQIKLLAEYLVKAGFECITTREPGGTDLNEEIRMILLKARDSKVFPMTEAFLYAASRIQHVNEIILPALEKGKMVISDRFLVSSLVYQGYARGLSVDKIRELNMLGIGNFQSDLTFYLDLSPGTGFERKNKDNQLKELDRLERENNIFHTRVSDGFNKLVEMNTKRIHRIDASQSLKDVHNDIIQILVARITDT